MIVEPKTRGFICTTAHPDGCKANVIEQINYVKSKGNIEGPKKVLVIGASTGYGLSSRITAAFGAGADTIGIFFEKPAKGKKPATAGWYNSIAFEEEAKEAGLYSKSINGDAFSNEIKQQTINLIKEDLGQVDLVIYSLASPKRQNPNTGVVANSVIKPIGQPFTNKTVDFHNAVVSDVTIDPANEEEIEQTVEVMGGEDWELWIKALKENDVLAKGAKTVAYSYIGPTITHAVYRDGTIGRAKDHLEGTAKKLDALLAEIDGSAFVSINKALVTQSSSAIPVVPLYISILYKIMKEKGIHEGCIEQVQRLFSNFLYEEDILLDEKGRIRIDELEMRDDVQAEITTLWEKINTDNILDLSDIQGYKDEFYKLFGFGLDSVDYKKDVDIIRESDAVQ